MKNQMIRNLLRSSRSAFGATVIFSVVINLLMLVTPIYMMSVFTKVLSSRSMETLLYLTLVVVLALVLYGVLEVIRSRMFAVIGTWFDQAAGPEVLAATIHQAASSCRWIPAQGLRDLSTLRNFLTGPSIFSVLDAPWTPVFIFVNYILHPILGMITLIGGAILFVLAVLNELATRAPLEEANVSAIRSTQNADSSLRNAEAIQAMGMLPGVVERWQHDNGKVLKLQRLVSHRAAAFSALSKFSRLLFQVLILAFGSYLVIENELDVGMMFAAMILMGRALAPMERAVDSWKGMMSARIAYRRLGQLFEVKDEYGAVMDLPRPQAKVAVEGLMFRPPGGESATLQGINFSLAPGEALGVIGPSGAGKSTLARLMVGAWHPSAGHVRMDGADMAIWHRAGGSQYVGYLPQDIELFPGTVRDNIARMGPSESKDVVRAARLAGLHELIMRLPEGYDTEIGDDGMVLSGGMRQRIGLARAMFGDVRVVVFDEPNSSLDTEGEEALSKSIAYLKKQGITVVVVAHRPAILERMDRILALKDGRMLRLGTTQEIFAAFRPAPAQSA